MVSVGFTFKMFIQLFIAVSIFAYSNGEAPAPYPARGWRPSQEFNLPSNQQLNNPYNLAQNQQYNTIQLSQQYGSPLTTQYLPAEHPPRGFRDNGQNSFSNGQDKHQFERDNFNNQQNQPFGRTDFQNSEFGGQNFNPLQQNLQNQYQRFGKQNFNTQPQNFRNQEQFGKVNFDSQQQNSNQNNIRNQEQFERSNLNSQEQQNTFRNKQQFKSTNFNSQQQNNFKNRDQQLGRLSAQGEIANDERSEGDLSEEENEFSNQQTENFNGQSGYDPTPTSTKRSVVKKSERTTTRPQVTTENPVEDSEEPTIAVSTAVANNQNGQYYILQEDGRLQRVIYMTTLDSKDTKNPAVVANLKYEFVEPLKGPIYQYVNSQLVRVN